MNYKKVGCFLVILFCLLGNMNVMASDPIIVCRKMKNQYFVCMGDAVDRVRPYLRNTIKIVGYGQKTADEGQRLANNFKEQLINALVKKGFNVDGGRIIAVHGKSDGDVRVEVYIE